MPIPSGVKQEPETPGAGACSSCPSGKFKTPDAWKLSLITALLLTGHVAARQPSGEWAARPDDRQGSASFISAQAHSDFRGRGRAHARSEDRHDEHSHSVRSRFFFRASSGEVARSPAASPDAPVSEGKGLLVLTPCLRESDFPKNRSLQQKRRRQTAGGGASHTEVASSANWSGDKGKKRCELCQAKFICSIACWTAQIVVLLKREEIFQLVRSAGLQLLFLLPCGPAWPCPFVIMLTICGRLPIQGSW